LLTIVTLCVTPHASICLCMSLFHPIADCQPSWWLIHPRKVGNLPFSSVSMVEQILSVFQQGRSESFHPCLILANKKDEKYDGFPVLLARSKCWTLRKIRNFWSSVVFSDYKSVVYVTKLNFWFFYVPFGGFLSRNAAWVW